MTEETRMRRQPKQARSQQRVEQLLNAAAQTFEEVGYVAATTNAIAARAGLPIGSLYQFFPNKESIMDALVERYLDELQQVVFVLGENLPISVLVGQIIDRLERFHQSHTGFRALFLDADVEHRIEDTLIQLGTKIIGQYFPALDVTLCRQTATAWLGITKGMTELTKLPGNVPEEVVQSETKLALLAYLRAVLVRAGVSLSDDLEQV